MIFMMPVIRLRHDPHLCCLELGSNPLIGICLLPTVMRIPERNLLKTKRQVKVTDKLG